MLFQVEMTDRFDAGCSEFAQRRLSATGTLNDFLGDEPACFMIVSVDRQSLTRALQRHFHVCGSSFIKLLGKHRLPRDPWAATDVYDRFSPQCRREKATIEAASA
jgi:hypothetical protein